MEASLVIPSVREGRTPQTREGRSAPRLGRSTRRAGPRPMIVKVTMLGLFQAFAVGWILHGMHGAGADPAAGGGHRGHSLHGGQPDRLDPLLHYLRDTTLAVPFVVAVLLAATVVARRAVRATGVAPDGAAAGVVFAATAALAASAGSIPGAAVHAWVFGADLAGMSPVAHGLVVALVTLRHTFAIAVGFVLFVGVPWSAPAPVPAGTDRPPPPGTVPARERPPGGRDVEPT